MAQKIYINGRFLTQTVTGVQRYAIELVQQFDRLMESGTIQKSQYEITLLVPKHTQTDLSLKHIKIKPVGNLSGHLWEQFELPFFSLGTILVNLCNTAPLIKRNQVVTIHDTATIANKQNFSFTFRTWYQILHRLLPYRTKKILTNSNFSRQELIKYYSIKESHINSIHLGVDHILNIQEDDSVIEKFQLQDKKYILGVSSINPNKNFRVVIDALQYINHENIMLVIVGEQDNPIFNKTKNEDKDRIVQLGYVSDEDLKALYKHATAFIFPSIYEGFGLPPLEAMACGCPVISSNTTAMPEILGSAVLYCDPFDALDVAQKINYLIENESIMLNMKLNGTKKSRQYTWEKCAKETFLEIEEVFK